MNNTTTSQVFLMMCQRRILLCNKGAELSLFSDTSVAPTSWDLERNT